MALWFQQNLPVPLYYILPYVAIGLAAAYWLLARGGAQRLLGKDGIGAARGFLAALVLASAVLSMLNYFNFFQFRANSFLNAYEFYHYYLGSKYTREIRYTDLYNASVIAERELFGEKNIPQKIRNLETGVGGYAVKNVFEKEDEIKQHFTSSRWSEWLEDIRWFKGKLGGSRWAGVLGDKGYNAPPTWSMLVGGLLTNPVPTSSDWGMFGLAMLDVVLIALATLCVVWAFGLRTALFVLMLLGTSYVMKFSHMKGALLRTDFAMALVVSVCMLKKERYAAAGSLAAYAALSRVFPAVFMFGIGAKAGWDLLTTRRVSRRYVRFFAAYGITALALVGASVVYDGGLDLWRDFNSKIAMHNTQISVWRIGFKYLFIGRFPEAKAPPAQQNAKAANANAAAAAKPAQPVVTASPATAAVGKRVADWIKSHEPHVDRKYYDKNRVLWWSIQGAVLLLCFLAVWGLRDHDAHILGFVPCFFLAAPTYYYYIMLLVPLLFFAPRIERFWPMLGLAVMFFTAIAGYYLNQDFRFDQRFVTYYWLSWLVLLTCVQMTAIGWGASIARLRRVRARRRRIGKYGLYCHDAAEAHVSQPAEDGAPVNVPPPAI